MKRMFSTLAIIAAIVLPAELFAKGETVRITIQGGDLAAPIQITDPNIIRTFHVWMGPGTSSNEREGLIVDWSRAIANPPKNLPIYEVLIVTSRQNPGTYTVSYVVDSDRNQGYVYLPGKGEPAYRDNTWLIYRGIEGNWFYAWREWEKVANPLIAKARKVADRLHLEPCGENASTPEFEQGTVYFGGLAYCCF